jgi:hypothetical protein
MDKGLRNEITQRKYLKRLQKIRKKFSPVKGEDGYALKHQSKRCSCKMCSKPKFNRAKERFKDVD